MRNLIKEALIKKYDGDIATANANMQVYLANPVGIGEHSEIMGQVDKQVEKIAAAEEKKEMLIKQDEKSV